MTIKKFLSNFWVIKKKQKRMKIRVKIFSYNELCGYLSVYFYTGLYEN